MHPSLSCKHAHTDTHTHTNTSKRNTHRQTLCLRCPERMTDIPAEITKIVNDKLQNDVLPSTVWAQTQKPILILQPQSLPPTFRQKFLIFLTRHSQTKCHQSVAEMRRGLSRKQSPNHSCQAFTANTNANTFLQQTHRLTNTSTYWVMSHCLKISRDLTFEYLLMRTLLS